MSSDGDLGHGVEQFSLLTKAGDRWVAELIVARLRSEGIPAHLSGDSAGPYPVSVGGLATTQVWVPARMLDEAREILDHTQDHIDDEIVPGGIGVSSNPMVSLLWWLVAALLLVWLLWVRIGRFL
jgi:hypothetical protein